MDKKGIIGIICAIVGLVSWQVYYTKRQNAWRAYQAAVAAEEAKKAEAIAKAAPVVPPDATTPGATPNVEGTPAAAAAPATSVAEEKIQQMATELADYDFTNLGGGIAKATLKEQIVDKKSHRNIVMNEFGKIPIGALSFAAGTDTNLPYTVTQDDLNRAITFERVDQNQLAVTKKFSLPKGGFANHREKLRDEYLVTLDVTFANRGQQPMNVPDYWVYTGSTHPIHENDAPLYIGLNYVQGTSNEFIDLSWFKEGGFFLWRRGARPVYPEAPERKENIRWSAVANQYYTSLVIPVIDTKLLSKEQEALRGVGVWGRNFSIPYEQWTKSGNAGRNGRALDGVDGAISMAGFALPPGATMTRQFQVLVGPAEYGRLREFNNYETEILDFGMFGIISKGLLNSLNWFRSILGSYWAAIMVLTIIIRSAMWPLQNRATQTAKKMQTLSPKLKELQDRFKDDPMRLQQETGKLWKEHGVNPLGGCLPMLVQIPIFFGFYNMLNRAVELRNNGFLWVQDLSQPDTVAFIMGVPLNILPLVMAGTMLVQMKLTPKAGDPMQQRIMMFMPLIFIALCYNYAAALALYWSVQNLFSIVQLFVTRDKNVTIIPPATSNKKPKR